VTGRQGAVVVGGGVNALGAVRALAENGVPVCVVCNLRSADLAYHSRHVSEHHWPTKLGGGSEAILDLLEHRAPAWRGWALFPTNDGALELLSRNRDRLSKDYAPTFPSWEIVRGIVDKQGTYEAAARAGIELPLSYGSARLDRVRGKAFDYPLVIKPSEGPAFYRHFGKKLLLARDESELLAALEKVEASGLSCELLDFVPGPDRQIFHYQIYMDRDGGPVGGFALRKLRQSPPYFGVARAAETAFAPELREQTVELLRELGWWGMASAAYKLDPRDGRYRLMEVNGRCCKSHGLARRAGINYALLAYGESVLGESGSGVEPNGWQGAWLHLHADLLYTARWSGREELDWADFRRSYSGPKTYAVWSARDPKPFLAEWGGTLRKGARMLVRREERDEVAGRVQWPTPAGGGRDG
jgi:predicted ATP-grasp superfamily ATP-dependent carboligase